MSDTPFPNKSEYFGVIYTSGRDNSWREDVFKCVASDQHRVVGRLIDRQGYGDGTIVFHRSNWTFETVHHDIVDVYKAKD